MAHHLGQVAKGKKIGFFGGTFDPIHFGHLNLAASLFKAAQLDELIFSPAKTSPTKQEPIAAGRFRKEMVELAIQDFPAFSCIDWELHQPGPSYTIDVIKYLKQTHPSASFFLLLGEDMLKGLAAWKNIQELLSLTTCLVGARPGSHPHLPASLEAVGHMTTLAIPTMDISSTAIRSRLSQGKECSHLVPRKVLDYIAANRLYCSFHEK